MPNFPAVDVALGLILVYFLLSVVVSATNEFIAARLNWRARDLERAIRQLLGKQEGPFRRHALIKTLVDPARRQKARKQAEKKIKDSELADLVKAPGSEPAGGQESNEDAEEAKAREEEAKAQARADALAKKGEQTRVNEYPSYIPARTFVAALLDQINLSQIDTADRRAVREAIEGLPASEARDALLALYDQAAGDLKEFRKNAERWFDDAMERVSGWYRRRVQWIILAISAALVFAVNADTLQIAKHLWTNPAAREVVANSASNATADPGGKKALEELRGLPLPLGWHWNSSRRDAQGFPFYTSDNGRRFPFNIAGGALADLVSKLIGLLLTTIALMLGAPFWFDTLSKLARLRNSGAPPPASDAVRRGEGEETRAGTPATFVIQATAAPTEREGQPGNG